MATWCSEPCKHIDDKALDCVDALSDLREQQKDLAKQKLDNIITYYDNRTRRLDNIVSRRNAEMDLARARGREEKASDYNQSIDATTEKLSLQVEQRNALQKELEELEAQGLIEKETDDWFEYTNKLDELNKTIIETRTSIIELNDAANKVYLTKLGYQLDALTNSAAHLNEMMDLHTAQGINETADSYGNLIDNGFKQIEVLQNENVELRKQQLGLDIMSEKYQELEQQIQSNISAINQMKVSQEGWNDSVVDLEIDRLKEYRDSLSKSNDQLDRQKNIQEALEDLERAKGQRTQRVYREGQGFVFETDQDALNDAQNNLEGLIQDELMNKIDDLIDALEDSKKDTNIYDANGNLLGTSYTLPHINDLSAILSNYYNNPNVSPAIEGLRESIYGGIVSGANSITNNDRIALQIGDVIVNEADNGNELAQSIIDQLPNAILQALYKK